ncbi:hypothetical protein HZ326_28631 [Fusarium oxysporum f. sp. albedinis]|nr:hypothetical protein HZ326_28631 [Fusarium oxysporum f. sp. albedinis]
MIIPTSQPTTTTFSAQRKYDIRLLTPSVPHKCIPLLPLGSASHLLHLAYPTNTKSKAIYRHRAKLTININMRGRPELARS